MRDISKQGVLDYDSTKPNEYFSGARVDWIDRLVPTRRRHILEIGCGHGVTGKYAFSKSVCDTYVGVEIAEGPAKIARQNLTDVLVGNVEDIDLPFSEGQFDALLMSEVLEHLVDPWATLSRLTPYLAPGALVFASSPNVASMAMIRALAKGRWDLSDSGLMDRTHLRWFTPATYREMFEEAGVVVDALGPLNPKRSWKQNALSVLTRGRYDHLFWYQINLIGHKP